MESEFSELPLYGVLGSLDARSVAFGYHAREACKGTIVRVLRGEKGTSMAEKPARYCNNCGRALGTEDRFCPNCGRPVHQTASVPTPEADAPVPPPPQAGEQPRPRISLGQFVAGFLVLIVVVWLLIPTGGGSGNGGGNGSGDTKVAAKKSKQEHKEVQQEQPEKKEPQPQKEEQAQGGQKEPQGEVQKPEQQEPEPQKPSFASFGDGTYQVGTDVQPGTYRTRAGSPYCYWERLRNFSGGINGILANGGSGAPGIVTIEATDVGFTSEGCGTWTKDLSAITASKTSFGAGAYIVGTDMEPGTYRNSGGRNCYWERLRGFNGGINAIIANGGTSNPSIVTIAPTDAGFQSNGCGTWTKLE